MQRYQIFATGEYYHLLGRGNYKQDIFLEDADYFRFLFLILHFQTLKKFPQLGRVVQDFVQHRVLDKDGIANRHVELVNFCLMPNHYHLTVKEIQEGGISRYMQRVLNGYTKYHNAKYEKSGHLFQGPFKAVRIGDNEQLLHLSAYIHRNPRDIKEYFNKENDYPWSSYQDYIHKNRWEELLTPSIVLGQFENGQKYKKFVDTSGTKEGR